MSPVTLRQVADGVGLMTIDHPPLNILTRAVLADLRQQLESAAADQAVRTIVLTSTGNHFSAGADVGEHLPPDFEVLIPEFLDTIELIRSCPVPVIAAVRGRCLGAGFELAQAADLIVAGEGATFGQPEIHLGVLPPAACVLLPARCGWSRATELILTGDAITAAEAAAAGLVVRVVADPEVEDAARALALRIARHSGAVIRLGKRMLLAVAGQEPAQGLDTARSLYVDDLMATDDAIEGLTAFGEKRAPAWRHQ
jgi:cyclohexa-1,5-dienecarbonyl-CoA hydratase